MMILDKTNTGIEDRVAAIIIVASIDEGLYLAMILSLIGNLAATILQVEDWKQINVIAYIAEEMLKLLLTRMPCLKEMVGSHLDTLKLRLVTIGAIVLVNEGDTLCCLDKDELNVSRIGQLLPVDLALMMGNINSPMTWDTGIEIGDQRKEDSYERQRNNPDKTSGFLLFFLSVSSWLP